MSQAVLVFGGLDAVFANAGNGGVRGLHEIALDDWETVIRVNLTGMSDEASFMTASAVTVDGGYTAI